MVVSVAYPAAGPLGDELQKPRTPQQKTGSGNWSGNAHVCDSDFMAACLYLRDALAKRGLKRRASVEEKNTSLPQPSSTQPRFERKDLWTPLTLSIAPPPSYEDSLADVPPDYTTTESFAICHIKFSEACPTYTVEKVHLDDGSEFFNNPLSPPKVDLSSLEKIHSHAGGKKNKKKKAEPTTNTNASEPAGGNAEQNGDGGDGDGAGAGDGGSGGGGNDGNGGDGWDDWDSGKKKKSKGKKQEEEDRKKQEEEEEAKKRRKRLLLLKPRKMMVGVKLVVMTPGALHGTRVKKRRRIRRRYWRRRN